MHYFLIIILVIILFLISGKNKKYSIKKELLKCESPIEEIMFKALSNEGYKPYTQVNCRKYRIDIAIYTNGRKIAIECDGKDFHSSPKQKNHDFTKDKVLEKEKWIVLRFTGSEINKNITQCIDTINKYSKKS